jgi:hypothetical protein
MTDRELAVEIARQILKGSRDLLRLIERRQAPEPKDE